MLGLILAFSTVLIDPAKSVAQFSVDHIFVEHVTGTVPVIGGSIVLRPGSPVPVSVSASLDAAHIRTGDDDRDGVLQTSQWFDTKEFPVWTFASTKIVPVTANGFDVEGLLTIRGVAHPEVLHVTVNGDPAHPAYRATGTIDRKVWGMAVTRLDPVIGNPVDVTIDIRTK